MQGYTVYRHTAETKRKLSEMHKGSKNPMYGKHVSEETRLKMSEAHKRGKLCKHSKGCHFNSKGCHFKHVKEVTH